MRSSYVRLSSYMEDKNIINNGFLHSGAPGLAVLRSLSTKQDVMCQSKHAQNACSTCIRRRRGEQFSYTIFPVHTCYATRFYGIRKSHRVASPNEIRGPLKVLVHLFRLGKGYP